VRRHDREIVDRREIDGILRNAMVCHLAFAVGGEPYVIPVSFGYDGSSLFIHTASEGRKIDCIGANPRVCFQVEHGVRLVSDAEDACAWSFSFESVIGYGEVVELTAVDDKADGLNRIMLHYSDRSWSFDPSMLAATRVWKIPVESVTGKRSAEKGS
jgi:nitroimidazol reductase NimA-like FMN-containing flavoprotein (pyridoxamine 5'-phosphate oxidase superfamily)